MRAFADLLETVEPADTADGVRNLVTLTAVKAACKITDTDLDTVISEAIPRVSKLIVQECRLARGADGGAPTFALETLRATWYVDCRDRGIDLHLPWRPPFSEIVTVTEDGTELAEGTDFVVMGNGKAVRLRRLSDDTPICWASAKIVVEWNAGFDGTLSDEAEPELADAAIEQLRYAFNAADRDPSLRTESDPEIGSANYSVTGGDVMGQRVLLPSVRDRLTSWRDPAP